MFSNTSIRRQFYATICGEISIEIRKFSQEKINLWFSGNLLTASSGAYAAWATVNFVNLQKEDTTFPSGPLTLTEATRVVSVFFASAIVGNLLVPHLVKWFGSKRTMFALGFPQLVGYSSL